jgi:hypothetical protein
VQVFIAGIMQGSRLDRFIDEQDYRRTIARAIQDHDASASIIDPNELHPHGVDYGDAEAKATLLEMFELAAQADLLVAYAPQASMGTAIEMWQAFRAHVPIVTVSPLGANWVVKHLSDVVLPDLSSFRSWVEDGGLAGLLSGRVS